MFWYYDKLIHCEDDMNIAWIQKTTFIDYPNKIATVLFTAGCNFRCRFCHNPENVLPEQIAKNNPYNISEEAFFAFLEKRKNVLDAVVICGWEPTLQPDLFDFAKKIKEKWFLVKLDTNGRDVNIVQKLVDDNLLDYVAMDIKNTEEKYALTANVMMTDDYLKNFHAMVDLLKSWVVDYEFRTTVSKWYHTTEDMKNIWQFLKGSKHYVIQNFKSGKTLDPNFDGESFSPQELEEFKQIMNKYIKDVSVRD